MSAECGMPQFPSGFCINLNNSGKVHVLCSWLFVWMPLPQHGVRIVVNILQL